MSLLYATHAMMVDDFHVETPVVKEAVQTAPARNQQSMAALMGQLANVKGGPVVKR